MEVYYSMMTLDLCSTYFSDLSHFSALPLWNSSPLGSAVRIVFFISNRIE